MSLGWVTVVWLTFILSEGDPSTLVASNRGSKNISGRSVEASAEESATRLHR